MTKTEGCRKSSLSLYLNGLHPPEANCLFNTQKVTLCAHDFPRDLLLSSNLDEKNFSWLSGSFALNLHKFHDNQIEDVFFTFSYILQWTDELLHVKKVAASDRAATR